jgi:hypothetical protein
MGFCVVSSSMNNISGVMIKLALPCVVICTVSPTGAPSLTGRFLLLLLFALILNCSSAVFTSCTYSKIEARWFFAFSHTFDSRSSTVVAIISTSFVVSDVSICFCGPFLSSWCHLLAPLAFSFGHLLVQMLLASVCPCMSPTLLLLPLRLPVSPSVFLLCVHLFCCFPCCLLCMR